jgi:hypothetical protein
MVPPRDRNLRYTSIVNGCLLDKFIFQDCPIVFRYGSRTVLAEQDAV